jgi:hypothetical protein
MELGEIDAMLREMREKRDHADTMLKLAEADAQRCADMGTGSDDIVWRYAAVLAEQVELVRVGESCAQPRTCRDRRGDEGYY